MEEGNGGRVWVSYCSVADFAVVQSCELLSPVPCVLLCPRASGSESHSPDNKPPVCAVVLERYFLALWGAGGCLEVQLVVLMIKNPNNLEL